LLALVAAIYLLGSHCADSGVQGVENL